MAKPPTDLAQLNVSEMEAHRKIWRTKEMRQHDAFGYQRGLDKSVTQMTRAMQEDMRHHDLKLKEWRKKEAERKLAWHVKLLNAFALIEPGEYERLLAAEERRMNAPEPASNPGSPDIVSVELGERPRSAPPVGNAMQPSSYVDVMSQFRKFMEEANAGPMGRRRLRNCC